MRRPCSKLQKLTFFRCAGLEGKNLAPLNELKNLTFLDVSRADLEVQGCQFIFNCENMKVLMMQLQTDVSPETFFPIKQCCNLQSLRIYAYGGSLTSPSLCAIASLHRLAVLVLYSESIEPAVAGVDGFTALSELPDLVVLEFHNFTNFSDESGALFAKTRTLSKLVMRNCKGVTTDVVNSLSSSSSLREVFIGGGGYTAAEYVVGNIKVLVTDE